MKTVMVKMSDDLPELISQGLGFHHTVCKFIWSLKEKKSLKILVFYDENGHLYF